MILTLITLPLIGAIIVGSISRETQGYDRLIRQVSLFTSIVVWIISSFLWVSFISLQNGTLSNLDSLKGETYQFVTTILSLNRIGELQIGVDGLGLIFVVLTAYLIPIAILSTWNTTTHNSKSQLVLLLLLESILFIVFTSLDLITFYVSFETVLIPLFIIIGLHGSTNARIRASMLLFMYTLIGSFFMLLGIMQLFIVTGTSDMILLSMKAAAISPENQRWIWLGVFFSIAIKSPLFPLHGWLFRAHSEASLAGSIILAGIVLKLATYAYLRILISMLPDACEYFRPLVLTVGCLSLIHGSLATLRQVDSKCFIAYSSVAHMSVVILGLASGTVNGIQGAMLLSVAHGLISPALFIVVGGIIYDRYHSRTIRYFRGLGSFMPSLKVWFFLATVASMATPGSLNWLGELLCITGTFETAPVAGILCSTTVILGAIYSIWLFNQIIGGHVSPYLALTNDLTYREWTLMIYLVVPAFILGVLPSIITNILTYSTIILVS